MHPSTVEEKLKPAFHSGDRILLTVREPSSTDARADYPGNYTPTPYVGEVEETYVEGDSTQLRVRWHLPAAYGYDTEKGTVSTLINVGENVWLETRKRPRNVVATIQKISDEEYQARIQAAANQDLPER